MSNSERPLRVLLIEDSENDAMLLLRELRRGGYQPFCLRVDTPEGTEEALRDADERGEPWEIIISDYYMPRFRGPEALATVRRLGYDTPFIVVSGKVGEDLAIEIMKAGAHDYITKENMARLNPAIDRELRESEVRRERQQAQEDLNRSEERFRRLVDQAADALFVHDLEGRFTDVNRRACESLGYTREELLKLRVPDVEMDYEPGALEKLWRDISSGTQRTLEGLHRRKDGTTFPVEVQLGLFEGEGTPLMLATARDVTERKKSEEELHESEERFRTTFEQAAVGISHVGTDGRWLRVNDKLCEIVGYTREEMLGGMSFQDITYPDDLDNSLKHSRRMLEGEAETYSAEKRYVRKDGSLIWIDLTTSLLRDPSGEPKYFISVTEDITSRKRAEAELQKSESSLAEAQRIAHIGNWYYDVGGGRAHWSDELYRIFGFEPREFVPDYQTFLNQVHPDDRGLVRRAVRGAWLHTDRSRVEYRVVRPDGEVRFVNTRYESVRDSSGRPTRLVGTIQDITERKRVEETLQMSETRFRTIIEQSPLSVQILSPDGRTLRVNHAWEELWGATLDDLGDYNLLEDQQLVDRGLMPYIQRGFAGEPTTIPAAMYDPEETIPGLSNHEEPRRWVQAFIYPVKDESGSIREVTLIHEDVTDRKLADQALRESEERYRIVAETASDGIVMIDEDSQILFANSATGDMFGYDLDEELTGRSLTMLMPEYLRQVHEASLKRYQETGERHLDWNSIELPGLHKNGEEIPLEVSFGEFFKEGRRFFTGFLRDITERKRAESEIQAHARQQAAIADLSRLALTEVDLQSLMDEAVETVSRTLEVEYCKVLELLPGGEELLLRAGVGWDEGMVGHATVDAHLYSQAGYTLISDEPVVSEDLGSETRFSGPPLLHGHGVVSGMSTVIRGHEGAYGVLGAHTIRKRKFSQDDVNFLQAVANVLATAIERQRTEDELRQSEERFRSTFEQAAVGVAHVGFGGEWLRVNDRLCDIVGYAREELIGGMSFQDITHPDDLRKDLALFDSLTAGEVSTYDTEKRYFRKDGSTIWINLTVSAATDSEGNPHYCISVIEDITARKRDEVELARQAELINLSHDAIVVRGTDGLISYWNQGAEEVYGWSKEEAVGAVMHELLRTRLPSSREDVNATLRLSGRWEGELRHTRRDGEIIEVESRQVVVGEAESKIVLEINRDITERNRNETELARLATFPELNPAPIIETDVAGNTTYLNPAADAWFQEIADQGSDHPMLADLEWVEAEVRSSGGRPLNREVRVGEKFYLQTISRLPESGLLRIYAMDVTERRRAEDGLRFLAEASATLSSSLEYHATLASVADLAVPGIADWCAVDIVENDGSLERLAVVHEDPEKTELARMLQERYPPDPASPYGVSKVLRTGQSELISEIPESLIDEVARDEGHREILRELGLRSYMAVPLLARGRVLGAITLVSAESGRVYGESDLELAEDLARRAAVAVDNALLYEESQTEISEREEAEVALRESRERYRTFIAQSTEGIMRFELEEPISLDRTEDEQIECFYRHGYLAECNDAMARMYGYESAEEIIGARVEDMLPRSVPENVEFLRAGINNGYRVVDAESQEFDRWGNRRYFLNNLTGIIEDGRVARAWGTQRDITEQRRAEEALRRSEQLYRTVVEQAGEGIFLFDAETKRILETNTAFQEMLGYSPEELRRISVYDLISEKPESVDQNVQNALEQRSIMVGERNYRRKDGSTVDVEVGGSVISYGGREVLCAVARDVTERKKAEEALRDVREAERNRIARDLHDDILQDIVYALQETNILQVVSEDDGISEELTEISDSLSRSIEGIRETIFELRLEDTLDQSFATSLRALVELNRRMSRKRYTLELEIEEEFPEYLPYRTVREIIRVLQEALNNARRHANPRHVWVRLGVGENGIWAEVEDDGDGFDPQTFTGGVGQHSMRHRATSLGGKLRVESEPGAGSTVRLEIPSSRLIHE